MRVARLDNLRRSLHELDAVSRLVWLLFVLLLWGGSLVAAYTSDTAGPITTAEGRDAFEQTGDPLNDDDRSAPFDVDDDDGDDQDDALAARATVLVPRRRAVSRSIASFAPRVRASSGHPRGLEEPPRS